MVGEFFEQAFHLLFDHSWVDAVATWFDLLVLQFPQQGRIPLESGLRVAAVAFRQPAFQDLEAAGE